MGRHREGNVTETSTSRLERRMLFMSQRQRISTTLPLATHIVRDAV